MRLLKLLLRLEEVIESIDMEPSAKRGKKISFRIRLERSALDLVVLRPFSSLPCPFLPAPRPALLTLDLIMEKMIWAPSLHSHLEALSIQSSKQA
ncbi:hypothetical protein B296_00030801 [Ensete ventricosum]|uniref:Uncharacterized protein n=1 Tax=Ensete ventricosum TaxID=4639 RepID=A0A426ZDU5_ENSVE|nr:hypothetical protein B296_00030801 [Ensete ventricosum]